MSLIPYLKDMEREKETLSSDLILARKGQSIASDYKEMVEVASKAEEKGREIAAVHREKRGHEAEGIVYSWHLDLYNAYKRASDLQPVFVKAGESDLGKWIQNVFWRAQDAALGVWYNIKRSCMDIPLEECPAARSVVGQVEKLSDLVRERTGKKCTWLLGVKEPYNVTSAINDITSCFHRALEAAQEFQLKIPELGYRKVGRRCRAEEGAPDWIVRACLEWDEAIDSLNSLGVLHFPDLEPAVGIAGKKSLALRVGSTDTHMVHLDLKEGTVEYFDTDPYCNRVVRALLEKHVGLKCTKLGKWSEEGFICTGLNRHNLRTAAKILAGAMSMDYRMHEEDEDWERTEEGSKIQAECKKEYEKWRKKSGLKYPNEVMEFCRVSKALGFG